MTSFNLYNPYSNCLAKRYSGKLVPTLGCLRVCVNVICFVSVQCEGPWLLMYNYSAMWINAKVNARGDACGNPAVLFLCAIRGEGPRLLAGVSGSPFYTLLYYTSRPFGYDQM